MWKINIILKGGLLRHLYYTYKPRDRHSLFFDPHRFIVFSYLIAVNQIN